MPVFRSFSVILQGSELAADTIFVKEKTLFFNHFADEIANE